MKTANYINLKKLYEIHDLLAYLYNALEHNDMSEQSQKIEEAINLLNEVKKEVFCDCNKPERGGEKENVCAVVNCELSVLRSSGVIKQVKYWGEIKHSHPVGWSWGYIIADAEWKDYKEYLKRIFG